MNQYLLPVVEFMGVIAVTLILSTLPAVQAAVRPVRFVHPRRDGLWALALYAALLLVTTALFVALSGGRPAAPASPAAPAARPIPAFTFTAQAALRQIGFALLSALPFALALRLRRQPLLSVGLKQTTLKIGLQSGLALGLLAIFLTGKTYAILGGLRPDHGWYLLAMLAVGLSEEFAFRGFIQPRLMHWWGDTAGWVGQAALFALFHLPQRLLGQATALPDLAIQLGLLFVSGLVFGFIARKLGGILAPGIYHGIHNWLQIL